MKQAKCQCGQFSVNCEGEHLVHVQCSCEVCQRRTGTPTSFQIYYKASQTFINGQFSIYTRGSVGNRKIDSHFCPNCGSFVFSEGEFANSLFGERVRIFALGCFNDFSFGLPQFSAWNQCLPDWFPSMLPDELRMDTQPESIDDLKTALSSMDIL